MHRARDTLGFQTFHRHLRRSGVPTAAERQRSGGLCGESALRLLDERLECGRLAHRQLGQDLAINLDPGLAEAVDKSTIGQPMGHGRRR